MPSGYATVPPPSSPVASCSALVLGGLLSAAAAQPYNSPTPTPSLQTPEEIENSFKKFISALKSKALSTLKLHPPLEPLVEILEKVIFAEHDPAIKLAMNKPSGYIARFFSHESWEEWLENRTALGRVIEALMNCMGNPTRESATVLTELNPTIIYKANQQAVEISRQLQSVRTSKANKMCGPIWECNIGSDTAPMSGPDGELSINIRDAQVECRETINYGQRDLAYKKAFRTTMRTSYQELDIESLRKNMSDAMIEKVIREHAHRTALHASHILAREQAQKRFSPEAGYYVLHDERQAPTLTIIRRQTNNCAREFQATPGFMHWAIFRRGETSSPVASGGYNYDPKNWQPIAINTQPESDVSCYRRFP